MNSLQFFFTVIGMAVLCLSSCEEGAVDSSNVTETDSTIPTDSVERKGLVIQPNEGEKLIFRAPPVPDSITVIVGPHNGSDRFAMGTQNLPVGYLVPMHKHESEDEILFFHEGHGHASVGGDTVEVRVGSTIFIPHGVWHSVHNTSDQPAQMVWFVAKPGLEDFFREASVTPGTPWTPLSPEDIERIGRKHGVIFSDSN